jgi:hypothetical protein
MIEFVVDCLEMHMEDAMPEPKTKTKIIDRLRTERKRLEQNLAQFSHEQMLEPNVCGEWSIKDILAHLADWEAHMSVWLEAARGGDAVAEIESGLNWTQFHEFNQRIYICHRDQTLDEVMVYFHDTHQQFMAMVEAMPEEEMLAPGRYAFLDKQAIYDWLGAYAGHDLWAKTEIRKWKKAQAK